MKKKITFKDACAVWLEEQRARCTLKTSFVNNAVRVSYFACFVDDNVESLDSDALNAIWDAFEVRWLGSMAELNLARPFMKTMLLKIATIMNDHNSGKKKIHLPVEWDSKRKKTTKEAKQ